MRKGNCALWRALGLAALLLFGAARAGEEAGPEITDGGTHVLRGEWATGLTVNAPGEEVVLRLEGAKLTGDAPLRVVSASRVVLELADGTENAVDDLRADDGGAAVDAACDVTVRGGGVLRVTSRRRGGLAVSGEWVMEGGVLVVRAPRACLRASGGALSGGTLLTVGTRESDRAALDVAGGLDVRGGTLLAVNASALSANCAPDSAQPSVLLCFARLPAGTLLRLEDASGRGVITFAPDCAFGSVLYSAPALARGETYAVYLDGDCDAASTDGVYADGAYSGGIRVGGFTLR